MSTPLNVALEFPLRMILATLCLGATALATAMLRGYATTEGESLAHRIAYRLGAPEGGHRAHAIIASKAAFYRITSWAAIAIGISSAAWLALSSRAPADNQGGILLFLLPPLAGTMGALWISALRQANRRPPIGPRIARATEVLASDYIPTWLSATTWGFVALAILAQAALGVLVVQHHSDAARVAAAPIAAALIGGGAPLLALTLTAGVSYRWAVRRTLDAPQPAADPLDLFWDDAARSEILRQALTAVTQFAFLTLFVMVRALADALREAPPNAHLDEIAGVGMLVIVFAFVAWRGELGRTWRHFVRRLWPDGVPAEAHA